MARQDNPTLLETIDGRIRDHLFGTRTAMLCKVVSYTDQPRPRVTVQVAANKWKREGGAIVSTPEAQLREVPVMELAWGPFVVRGFIEPGDFGVLLVCDRDIDTWITERGGDAQGSYSPGVALIHDINDALYLPAVQPDSVAQTGPKVGNRQLAISTRDSQTSIKLDAGRNQIDIDSSTQVNINSGQVNVGSPTPLQGAHSVARVGVDYVVTMAGPMPIMPGTAVPVPPPVPVPGPPSAHKVRG